ncbi:polysaccharide lyase [Pseudonocardia sp. H11422]|uniref:polysaccharide lyase n=1 Tax=Pseudonocardia sp. H11422 TaxID=2835866 RepID=UPI001BDC37CB|nr:polysaccharide lyase [Pseudonocardia sp. H11422]
MSLGVLATAAAAALSVTAGLTHAAHPGPDPTASCSWRGSAQRLVDSLTGVTDARAESLLSALTQLGIRPGDPSPDGCRSRESTANGGGGRSPGPGPSMVPPDTTVVFEADYETGDLSEWDTCQNREVNGSCSSYRGGDSASVISGDVVGRLGQQIGRAGEQVGRVARFVVGPGDVPDFGGGERSEVAAHSEAALTREGDERWYEFSLRFAEDFPNPVEGDWFIVMQWHSGSGSPPLAIEISPEGTVDIAGDGVDHERQTIGPVRPGEWVDYTLRAGFSQDPAQGFVEAWENGVQTVERYARATMSSDENYLKMGIYRGNADSSTAEVWIDGPRVSAPSAGSSSGGSASSEATSDSSGSDDSSRDDSSRSSSTATSGAAGSGTDIDRTQER